MKCAALIFTVLGFVFTVGATALAGRAAFRERSMREQRVKDAMAAIEADREAGDDDMPRYKAALGANAYTYNDVMLTREIMLLEIAKDQIREYGLPLALAGIGVTCSFVGSILSI